MHRKKFSVLIKFLLEYSSFRIFMIVHLFEQSDIDIVLIVLTFRTIKIDIHLYLQFKKTKSVNGGG